MKTNKQVSYALLFIAISAMLVYNSCKSDCKPLYALPNPSIFAEIKNSQNRNILDPATPGHLDTALFKKLNPGKFNLSRPGFLPVLMVFDYIGYRGINIINLTNTDQDTITVNTEVNTQQCNTSYALREVKYNGVTFNADSAGIYFAHK